jgi:BlaI family penicillinase repressor
MMPSQKLPDAELDVLACLHRLGPATAREVREALAAHRPMTHGALVTLLSRLEAKGLVTHKKGTVGKAFIFAANRPATKTFGGFMKQVVQRVFHGDTVALVASLFESRRPTKTEVDQLQELLDELRKKEKQ